MLCCCCSQGGRFVLNNLQQDNAGAEERISLMADELDSAKRRQRHEITSSILTQFPTFIIDLILEFEQDTKQEKIKIYEHESRSGQKCFTLKVRWRLTAF